MIYLNVPFAQKDQAKSLGARWDPVARKWYIPEELTGKKELFSLWLDNVDASVAPANQLQGSQEAQGSQVSSGQQNSFFQQASVADHFQNSSGVENKRKGQSLSQFLQRIQQVIWQNFAGGHWVVAELSNINERRGHLYLELSETDENGRSVANARAMIWKSQAAYLKQKFHQETQMELGVGQKLLMLCEVQFHPQYGLSLVVQEIDSSFSLGELEQKVREIREKLIAEGIYGNNKKLLLNNDFFRVAVIAPPKAAGLGDFQADAEKLSQLNLCQFDYFHSSFQGNRVEKEFEAAFEQVLEQHQQNHYDALVIIRGGGAKLDLHQLNEYSIAKQIAQFPLPVLSGIGHERDNTILDEVAHSRFDTPSKVVHYIWQQIQSQAMGAKQNWMQIQQVTQQTLIRLERQTELLWQEVEQHSHQKLNYWKQATLIPMTRMEQLARNQLSQEKQSLDWLFEQVQQNAQQQFNQQKQLLANLDREINQQALSRVKLSKQQLQDWMALILNAGPKVQIERGFAVVSNPEGETVVSKSQALNEERLNIQFKDGKVAVNVDPDQEA